jgi:hypothetical protein
MVAKSRSQKNRHRRAWSRRARSYRKHRGGSSVATGSPVGDTSMLVGQKDSLAQGTQFLNIHKAQHGGSAPYPLGVTASVLTGPMVASARTGPLDTAISQIQGMQDGGRRNKRTMRKKSKKSKKSRSRRHRGGAHVMTGSPVSENSMLLPSGLEKQAALNNDWSAARDPNYWAPKN